MYKKISGTVISYNFKTKEMKYKIDKDCQYAKNTSKTIMTSYWHGKDFFPIEGDKVNGLQGKFMSNSFPNKGNNGKFVDVFYIIRTDNFDNKMKIIMEEVRVNDFDGSSYYNGFVTKEIMLLD